MADTAVALPMIDVAAVIAASQEDIKARVVEQVKKDFVHTMTYAVQQHVQQTVDEFYKEHLDAAIKAEMETRKPEILAAIGEAIVKSTNAVGVALAEKATKNMTNSWDVKKIIEGLFG